MVSLRPNYFIFIGDLKTEGGEGEPPLDPPLPPVFKTFVLSIFVWRLKTGLTVLSYLQDTDEVDAPVKKKEREDVKVPDSKLDKRLQVTTCIAF